MAHKKGLGSSRNGRDSHAKRLGVKVFDGQTVTGDDPCATARHEFRPGPGTGSAGRHDLRNAGRRSVPGGRRGRSVAVTPAE